MKRLFLLAGAGGWGISILGILLSWPRMNRILQNMGTITPVTDPQIQYWFRMATGGWSIIGFFFLVAFLKPDKYKNLVPIPLLLCLFLSFYPFLSIYLFKIF